MGYFTNLKPYWMDHCLKGNNFILISSTKSCIAVIQKEKPKQRHWSQSSRVSVSQIWWKEFIWPPPPITALQLENQKPYIGKTVMMQLYSAAEHICRIEIKWEEKRFKKMCTSTGFLLKAFQIFWTWTRGTKVEPSNSPSPWWAMLIGMQLATLLNMYF